MKLIPFTYADRPVRVVEIDGDPWFVLADLCKVLNISNAAMVSGRLDATAKGVSQIDTPGGRQSVTIVSEAGMYEVVITAKGVHDLAAKVGANPALVADALDSEAGAA